jgi:hypothetical protein
MTKEQAQKEIVKRFTNLIDGKVLPFASVATIINDYESLLSGSKMGVMPSNNGITKNFEEEWINELYNEADCYNGI